MKLYDYLSDAAWLIRHDGTHDLNKYETIFSLSNGSLGVRGNLEEMPAHSITGTFLGGIFDRDVSWCWDMVNQPNFLELNVRLDGERLGIESSEVLEHTRILDMKKGILYRCSRFKTQQGKTVQWEAIRAISIVHSNLCFEQHCFIIENADGNLNVSPVLNSDVKTLDSWQQLNVPHLEVYKNYHEGNVLYSCSKLMEARHPVGAATMLECTSERKRRFETGKNVIRSSAEVFAQKGAAVVFDRFSTVQARNNKDYDLDRLKDEIISYLKEKSTSGFENLMEEQSSRMNSLWGNCDVGIEGDEALQKQIRFSLFHLIQAGPRHDERASIGAKALTGYRYAGHIFWDTEMFMLPFYVFTDPQTAKNILMYRYHLLPGARRNAATFWQKGARFPYRSAGTGDEAITMFCPGYWVKDPHPFYGVEKWWFGENEVHISSAIAYGTMLYYKATGDTGFMLAYGLEMLCEISRFYASLVEWNPEKKQYDILKVMGPDEYHSHSNNNAYTNYMAYNTISWTLDLLEAMSSSEPGKLAALKEKIALSAEELKDWTRKRALLYLPKPNNEGIIPQCDGFFDLKDFDKGNQDIIVDDAAPFVENAVGEPVAKYSRHEFQCTKQCDTVLLFCLFPDLFDHKAVLNSFDYYERRTYHMSSLSPNTASIIALRLEKGENAYKYLNLSSTIDLNDVQGNTKDGIHSAAAGGTWMASVYGFGGLTLNKNFELELMPKLPGVWKSISYSIFWHGSRIRIKYDGDNLNISLEEGDPVEFKFRGRTYLLTHALCL